FQLQDFVYHNFKVPEALAASGFKGKVSVIFEIDTNGVFKVVYADAVNPELISETKRVFAFLPKVLPAMQIGKPIYSKYSYNILIPLKDPGMTDAEMEIA